MIGTTTPTELFVELTMSNVERYNKTQEGSDADLNWVKFKEKMRGIHETCVSLANNNKREIESLNRKLEKVLNTIW